MRQIIYNIGTLAGILPAGVKKLEGEQMNHVECLHDAYLVIEDGVISEFGSGNGAGGFQNRATPLAAGVVSGKQTAQWAFAASSHEVGGVVLKNTPHRIHAVTAPEADVCMRVFCVYSFHQVGAVEVSGGFAGNDVVFHSGV